MFGFSSLRCIDCRYLDNNDKNKYGEYYCPEVRRYVDPSDYTCRYYVPNYYIMTAYSMIKGLSFNNDYMITLIKLRDNYMVNNETGKEFLDEYKTIGPAIADKLLGDMYSFDIANELEEKYIIPAVEFANNNELDMAQQTYIDMFKSLKIRYGYEPLNKDKIKRL